MVAAAPPRARRAHQGGADTRRELLDAALAEFAAVGFDAASTRAIAARAGVRQGQLTYHFDSKDALWRATIDHLFDRFDAEFTSAPPPVGSDALAQFETLVRTLVRTVSKLPELNRIMIHEATVDSERLAWLVARHVRARFDQFSALWLQVRHDGGTHLDTEPLVLYYSLIGAASLMYVNAPEINYLLGRRQSVRAVTDALVEAHADTIVAMLLGSRPRATINPLASTKGN